MPFHDEPPPSDKLSASAAPSMRDFSKIPFHGESPPSTRKNLSSTTPYWKEFFREEEMASASPQKKKRISDLNLADPIATSPSASLPPALDLNLEDLASRLPSLSPPPAISPSPAPHAAPSAARGMSTTSSGSHELQPSSKRDRWEKKQEKKQAKRLLKEEKRLLKEEKKKAHGPPPLPPTRFKWPESSEAEHSPDDLEEQFCHFLQGCNEALSTETVFIDFMDQLAKNEELAFLICNEKSWSKPWLTSAMEKFARENGYAAQKISPHFINKPERIYAAKDLISLNELTELKSIFAGARK